MLRFEVLRGDEFYDRIGCPGGGGAVSSISTERDLILEGFDDMVWDLEMLRGRETGKGGQGKKKERVEEER